ncbi:GAF and ANTAR domain-containing protein [Nesterenkonia sp. LB17]|uniref:GAF and ANTAR domain-containing protein n=1 Tax=unclassified Nesterenkonia TaxID=2629769 RepID=UPI001F4CB233|nr:MULTISPECIES: GAF and ANTAR domain-containing protein [unclassified Nesterenkonia]MCH8560161.1 GAF and ANTAR domain-containing protein [Nesterenkonia sp. DZ6]MCH8564015.1 GAF and ANTAR domain-containing protein [Nesterenkonia sp. YGD6]MCH8564126.1 GAF and ANTAR domain-containing protein [Nesterenkonia sp. LB17]MCH8569755.1 GAF and ANTAR domain-containing protein [Nesterenkonia sp. AY15]
MMMPTELPLDELSLVFARVNGMLLSEETVERAVELLAQAAKSTVPGAIGAGVTLISDAGSKESAGSTDRVVREADDLQYVTGEGPCLSAWASRMVVNVQDVQSDPRWPDWSAAVVGLPIRSVLSAPLQHQEIAVGAMKVYSAADSAFTSETERLLTMFAVPAAALLSHVQTKDLPVKLSGSLRNAMGRRDMINIGKGILMAQSGFDEEAATLRLIQVARAERITVLEVAEHIIADGQRQGGNQL